MRVVADNSGCCGVKIIRDLQWSTPANELRYKDNLYGEGHNEDEDTSEPRPYARWDRNSATSLKNVLTYGDFFFYLVNQIKERRPSGMIIVNLAAPEESCDECFCECGGECCGECCGECGGFDDDDVARWRPLLVEAGFKEVTFINSNTGARIHQFTCIY